MDIIRTIVLGIVQGATEFLPVSSSGHLVIVSGIIGRDSSFEFDVLVNFGTLMAIIIFYRRRLIDIAQRLIKNKDIHLLLALVIATLPAAVIGFLLQDFIESELHNTWVVVIMLFVIGLIMVRSKRWESNKNLKVNNNVNKITFKNALLIGVAQCFSLISGSSRSGTTILAALKLGFNKKRAAEWSFLMGIPIILGASVRVLMSDKGQTFVKDEFSTFFAANIVSFISGMLAITVLMRVIQKYGLYYFGWYRIAIAAVLVVLLSANII